LKATYLFFKSVFVVFFLPDEQSMLEVCRRVQILLDVALYLYQVLLQQPQSSRFFRETSLKLIEPREAA
jgi:hypothetical protein